MLNSVFSKAFAPTKAIAVEQFSFENSNTYSSGFALSPSNVILNFTITGLTPSTNVDVAFTDQYNVVISGKVTTDGSGTATFAIGAGQGKSFDIQSVSLTVDGNDITLASGSKTLVAGKIYNINRSVASTPAARALSEATTDDIGKIAGVDGNIYDDAATASAASTTAVAMIAYVGNESNCSHGLAIALENVGNGNTWDSAAGLCNAWNESTSPKKVTGGTWRLPTIIDWQYMFIGCGPSGSVEDNPTVGYSMSYSGLATKLNEAGGAALPASLWSTDGGDTNHWYIAFDSDNNATFRKSTNSAGKTPVRACLVF